MYQNNEAVRAMAQPIIDHQNNPLYGNHSTDLMTAHWATALMTTVWNTSEPWSSLTDVGGKITQLWPGAPVSVVLVVLDAWLQYRDLPTDHFSPVGGDSNEGVGVPVE